ncbi:MAG: DNA alkylation repair protein [Prevotellaceae bacterium]|jgi:3-methyladenine DNA glycosylase AlkD|nr:DNA alkylation repair protein [Prevotellaceae bacterium]
MDIIFELLSRLISQKNGAVSENMTDNGIIYKINYGVALHTIKKIAEEYAPDHELAQLLYERDEREAKLAAVYIEDAQAIKAEQLERWAKDFINVELAEVASGQLFYKTPYALPHSYEWCMSPNIYLQKAGWTIIARIAMLEEITNQQLIPYLKLAESADLSQAIVRQAVISALVRLGMKNDELKKDIIELTSSLKNESADKQPVAEEVLVFGSS